MEGIFKKRLYCSTREVYNEILQKSKNLDYRQERTGRNLAHLAVLNYFPELLYLLKYKYSALFLEKDVYGKTPDEYIKQFYPELMDMNVTTFTEKYLRLQKDKEFLCAYMNDDFVTIKKMLSEGFDINRKSPFLSKYYLEIEVVNCHYYDYSLILDFLRHKATPDLLSENNKTIFNNFLNNFMTKTDLNILYYLLQATRDASQVDDENSNFLTLLIKRADNIDTKEMKKILTFFFEKFKIDALKKKKNDYDENFDILLDRNYPHLVMDFR